MDTTQIETLTLFMETGIKSAKTWPFDVLCSMLANAHKDAEAWRHGKVSDISTMKIDQDFFAGLYEVYLSRGGRPVNDGEFPC